MKKIIKWMAVLVALVVLVSLVFYVGQKKHQPAVSSDELLQQALTEIRDHKNYPKAISISKQALVSAPDYIDILVTLGRAYMLQGILDSAKTTLENVLEKDPKNAQSLLYLVTISFELKDTSEVLRHLTSYVNYYPEDKRYTLKNYLLLLEHSEYKNASTVYRAYAKRFGSDSIQIAAFNFWETKAIEEKKQAHLTAAYESYQRAIQFKPAQPQILQQLVGLSMHFKDYRSALRYNGQLLKQDSTNRQYLVTQSNIYQQLNDKDNTALYAGKAYAQNQADPLAKKNLVDMYLAFAKDETGVNKVHYASLALHIMPAQKDALLYLVNAHLEAAHYGPALEATNRALAFYPNDQIFIDKKAGILYSSGNYKAGAEYLESVLQQQPTLHNIQAYEEATLKLSSELTRQERWPEAIERIQKGLLYSTRSKPLLLELVNVYTKQKNTRDAIATIDRLLLIDPANDTFLFKKSGLLEVQHDYGSAAFISGALFRKHPENTDYKNAYRDQLTGAERAAIAKQDWNGAIQFYNESLATGKPGYYPILYAITAYNGKKDSLHVLQLTDTAIRHYPGDSFLLVKRSLAYGAMSLHPASLAINKELINRYPSDSGLQVMYLDQLYTAGKYYEKQNKNDSAIRIFLTAYTAAPRDTFALMNLSAIYFLKRQYDSAIVYADLGLQTDSTNEYLLMKKSAAHEQLKQYRSAYLSAKRVLQLHPSKNITDYTDYLRNKTYLNQAGITHLQSFFSSPGQYASVTGLQYMRRFEKGSITAKLNYGDRPSGAGVQAGVDVYYTHDSNYYSNGFVNLSTGKAFPYWQAGYSLFRNFKKGWEAELGVRYLGFDSIHNYIFAAGVSKYLNNTWLNGKTYFTYNNRDWFQSYQVTLRQYLNDKNDYLSLIGGLGNIPDDQSLYLNFNNFSGFTSRSIGAGFQKNFKYSTTLQIFFNYNNLQVTPTRRIDQYDFYLTLLRNF
ncbi:MAG: tetratricopeptide repeat protein [Sediminibacterium sp.]